MRNWIEFVFAGIWLLIGINYAMSGKVLFAVISSILALGYVTDGVKEVIKEREEDCK